MTYQGKAIILPLNKQTAYYLLSQIAQQYASVQPKRAYNAIPNLHCPGFNTCPELYNLFVMVYLNGRATRLTCLYVKVSHHII
jgi:hypothetical protein